MIKKLALLALIAALAIPVLAIDPMTETNGTATMVVGEESLGYDTGSGDTVTFTITSGDSSSSSAGGLSSSGRTAAVPELEAELDSAEDAINEAKGLISSDPDAATALLDSATSTQEGVNTILNTDVIELETEIGVIDIEELGLSEDDINEGKKYLEDAKDLIAQAEAEEDLEKRAELLEEALALQRKALELIPEVEKIAQDSDTAELSADAIEEALESAASDDVISILEAIGDALPEEGSVTIDRSFATYQVTNIEASSDTTYRTRISLTINAGTDLQQVIVTEVIPKSVAADVSEIIFGTVPKIIQEDPIVQWTLTDIAEGQSQDLSYVIKDKVMSLDATTLATVKEGPVEKGPVAEVEGEIKIGDEAPLISPEAAKATTKVLVVLLIVVLIALGYKYYPKLAGGSKPSVPGKTKITKIKLA